MSTCPSCSAPLSEVVSFCIECGFTDGEDSLQDPWHGRLIAGRFRLVSKLGAGGMGDVYEAIQDPIGRSVALKILNESLAENPGQVERFKREAQAASQLSHPNTIVVHDFGQDDDGTLFIAMEYLKGESLNQRVIRESPPSPEWVVKILSQVCDSLQEAHEAGMVHRDLKPENIFITHRGSQRDLVKVLDFGIAKVTHSPTGDTMDRLTQQGTICGTPHYMAPEQIRDLPVDHRADIYALGVLLYWLIAGREPFDASKVVDLLTMHIKEPPPAINLPNSGQHSIWSRLETVARHALAKDPKDRPQSAMDLREALTKALGKNVVMSSAGGVTTINTPPPRRLRARVVWGIAATLAATAALVWSFSSLQSPAPAPADPSQNEPSNADRMSALFWAEDMIDSVDAGAAKDTQKAPKAPEEPGSFWRVGLLGEVRPGDQKPSTESSKTAAPPRKFGEVQLLITPDNATVRLGNFPLPWSAKAPTVRLPVGRYVLDITVAGKSVKKSVTVRAGELTTERVRVPQDTQ